MAQVKFVGDPAHGGEGPRKMVHHGYDFSNGAVEVTDEAHLAKFRYNSHFEVATKARKAKKSDGRES